MATRRKPSVPVRTPKARDFGPRIAVISVRGMTMRASKSPVNAKRWVNVGLVSSAMDSGVAPVHYQDTDSR